MLNQGFFSKRVIGKGRRKKRGGVRTGVNVKKDGGRGVGSDQAKL